MRIENCTDETVTIEPGETVDFYVSAVTKHDGKIMVLMLDREARTDE